jgi:UDP-N-acetylmuramate: L-alanyl-gamma-D-glutamyl-meso-diaminopimelate ligase
VYWSKFFQSVYLDKNLDLIIDAIEKFPGVSRRNEIIFNEKSFVVIDDFAHNPDKFKAAIESVQKKFSEYRIIVVIEPNMGNRTIPSIEQYKDTFSSKAISQIIIPRWKNSSIQENSNILTEKDFATKIDSFIGNPKCKVILDDSDFLIYLTSLYTENKVPTVILFMSSEPFRGLIEKYKEKLSNPPVV